MDQHTIALDEFKKKDELVSQLTTLATFQHGLMTIKRLMKKNDEFGNDLADVYNVLLDTRSCHVKHLLKNELFTQFDLLVILHRYIGAIINKKSENSS